ncbi:MAG: LPS export ABC transporter ATP-binding protein [Bacteroidetes bacterium]|nr:LPS export ABC transporter ATP-binding protein [Bacteroidota bacterium]
MTLKASGLIKVFYDRMTVKGVSLKVSKGEIVGLLGANGAGKTTTFYMIAGLIPPTEGEVFLDNKKITELSLHERARMGIGYLPQEASVFRQLSVEDNIMAVLQFTNLTKKKRKEKQEKLLDEFGLSHIKKNKGNILSGGERRRTEIARALATDPTFLLLDEPFAGVDPIAVEEIQEILKRLKEKDLGILITDHNVDETLAITDHSYIMFEGNILKHGTAEELAKDEKVKKVYLGENYELNSKIKKTLKTQKKRSIFGFRKK